ncbi:type II toxin-antitoxin system PemK/MazF family toxin [Nocardia tengchongensis]|uniref:type II toxin-antitoxin system PemK/MazF family toxin n=1 Tax=Nocardia tengchongensis TaxID=2055889 RepID=UPI0036D01545
MTTVARGEIWTYQGIARVRTVLVVSADELNMAGLPMTCEITDVAPTGMRAMLAVPVPGHGRVLIRPTAAADPAHFMQHLGTADPATMAEVNMSLRAAFGLSDDD